MHRLGAILGLKCPRCLRGHVFTGLFKMNARCPVCDLEFEREPGYFLGAMYFSYALAVIVLVPISVLLLLLGFSLVNVVIIGALVLVLLTPWLFKYSRVLWMHMDLLINPG
ncbi:MAG: DUF983 domain-containing protein [Chloroflexi bacterium]|nr:DUF983 domain-containing protein [Chloroflexota bacterium]